MSEEKPERPRKVKHTCVYEFQLRTRQHVPGEDCNKVCRKGVEFIGTRQAYCYPHRIQVERFLEKKQVPYKVVSLHEPRPIGTVSGGLGPSKTAAGVTVA